tara:strand:+ start:146 stop:661 length:516 start_codon:yes stop_codon:yes gene_type:complete
LNQVQKVTGILTPKTIYRLQLLLSKLDWLLAADNESEEHNKLNLNLKFLGLSRDTLDNPDRELWHRLNDFGLIITESVCQKIDLKYKNINRFMWNLYKPNEEGQMHTDCLSDNCFTILYSLNTSDGYLIVGDQKIYDKQDEAKIFKSNILHKGVGPTKDKYRLNLNIVLST